MARVTIKDIAERAGMSISAVSQALRQSGTVGKATSERIRKLATEMGYTPNALLSSLAARHFRNDDESNRVPMALILPPDLPKVDYETNIGDTIQYANKLGYRVHVWHLDKITHWGQLARTLYNRGVVGVVIFPRIHPIPPLGEEWNRFALVMVSNNPAFRHFHPVYVDHHDLVYQAWSEVKALGYKRIGWAIMRHDPEVHDDRVRRGAANECVESTPIRDRIPVLWDAEIQEEQAVNDWYKRHKPEVIIGFNVLQAWNLIKNGVRIPEDVAFANLHNFIKRDIINGLTFAGLTDMDEHILPYAIDHMDQLIRHRTFGFNSQPRKVLLSATWEHGGSCPARG
ncbi:MAG: LacI family DNA-binding transcriptional regulator [Verrucomicrobiota bacterium]|nr:LacI family DNA-binding transcriptional regulator [Verrucomicrobiota bacterium]